MASVLEDLRAIRNNTAAAVSGSRDNIRLTSDVLNDLDCAGGLISDQLTPSALPPEHLKAG